MSMDIYHQIEGLDGFAAKAREVSQVKGTSMPERIDSIAAAYKAVVDLLNMPRQENVIKIGRASCRERVSSPV